MCPSPVSARRRQVLWIGAAMLIVSSVCVAVAQSPQAHTGSLSLVSTSWPPFTNQAGQPRFALDLVEEACRRIGVTVKTTFVGAPQFTDALMTGPFDGSAAVWKDPEREKMLLFSQPYLENRLVLIGRHGADVSAKTIAGLQGKRVAVVAGYSYGDTLDMPGPLFVRTDSEEASLAQLLQSRVDYTLMDELVVQSILSSYAKEAQARLQIGSAPLVTRPLYLAIKRTHPDAESIVSRFNGQLRGMMADGTYHRLLHIEWIEADINGDGIPEFVPQSDRPGSAPPKRTYSLFSDPAADSRSTDKIGFYVGGTIYEDWKSVPASFKTNSSRPPDPRGSTGSIFTFNW